MRELKTENVDNDDEQVNQEEIYSINLFRLKTLSKNYDTDDFKIEVAINNSLDKVIVDTGAKISVCGMNHANKRNLLKKIVPSKVRTKPYKSNPITVTGEAICAVTCDSTSILVTWHLINGPCEPMLVGSAAVQLNIIKFNHKPVKFHLVLTIQNNSKGKIQTITDKQVVNARETDYSNKEHRQQELNAAKYVKKDNFQIGDTVLIRNFNKRKKLDPLFLPEPYLV